VGGDQIVNVTHILKALALAYDGIQDRILAVVNPGALDSWSFWLTRHLVLKVLGGLPPALEATSPVAKQAPAEYRSDLVAFEREAALATTEGALTRTDPSILRSNAMTAELALSFSVSDQGDGLRLELRGERGGLAVGMLGRPELQRVFQMLHDEARKAAWLGPLIPAGSLEGTLAAAKPVRH
jgi:hypothetical protein